MYGALELDPCGIFTVLAVFMARWGWMFVALYNFLWHLWGIGVVRLALVWCLACVCFFMLNIGGCLWVWRIGAQASPSHEPLLSELGFQLRGPFGLAWGLMAGGRGFEGWLCQRWKPLDIPGTHLP